MDVRELKNRLGNDAKNIIASGLNIKLNKKNKAICPYHREETASFCWNSKDYEFKCFGCGKTVDIFTFYTDKGMSFTDAVNQVKELLGETDFNVRVKPKQAKPNLDIRELNEKEIEIWKSRGIAKETLDFWQVKGCHYAGADWMKFLYKDDKGKMPYANMRKSESPCPNNCKAIPAGKDLKAILWGIWHIDISKPLVITEGQPDAMIIWQSGYKNVVSVPAGASNFTWIKHCYEWLQNFEEIYIYGDNDDAGVRMISEIKNRLGGFVVSDIKHNHKDANEVYLKDGPETILSEIEDAINKTPEGLSNIAEVEYEFEKSGEPIGIKTGFRGLDYHIEYLKHEEVSVVFGRTGEGKSTFVSQLICNCIENQIPVFLYSGEMGDKKIKKWLYKQACGMSDKYCDFITKQLSGFFKTKKEIKPSVVKKIDKWLNKNFITLDKKSVSVRVEIENLFKTMELAIRKYGCKLVIIDNLMSAIQEQEGHYFTQSNFMARCVQFAIGNGCHVMLVAHPNKTTSEGGQLSKNHISGSGNIINMADLVIGVEKFTKSTIEEFPENMKRHGCLRLLKNREDGVENQFSYKFNPENKRFTEFLEINEKHFDKEPKYSWDTEEEEFNPF